MRQRTPTVAIAALTVFILLASGNSAVGQESKPDIDSLIREVDQLYRSQDSYSEVEMVIHTPHWERTLTMKVFTEKTEKTLIRITDPAKERGTATLRIGNEMWNYLPKTNKVIRIPPSMMMGSWMGSDFTNDDLVKEFTFFDDYEFTYTTPEDAVDSLVYINCIPHQDLAVVWGNVVIAVVQGSHLPVWMKYYDEDGELVRLLEYRDVGKLGGRVIPQEMRMIPKTEEDKWTVVRYLDADFDVGLDEDIFSLRALRTEE